MKKKTPFFEDIIDSLNSFWRSQGCCVLQSCDLEVGAGTFHAATFFKSLDNSDSRVCYVQPCRRPTDGRFGQNPLRAGFYYQYQVVLKPSPENVKQLYLNSLKQIGFNLKNFDLRFVEDDWESPTLGAWGLGWEVWLDSLEVTQFTYFQQIGGVDLKDTPVEITYGLERLAMYLQNVSSISDIKWNKNACYGDIHDLKEKEFCSYNFEFAGTDVYKDLFLKYEGESGMLLNNKLVYPAYEMVLKMSHAFNVLDARGALSVTERQNYISRIRKKAKESAELYLSKQGLGPSQ
ncbi:MAG: glycine--tRNA ligase subunit alpha [Candidatus Omnitrophica bacterium]|nr:glycine--tRNA ligase subunit alpha [Candidatus Omnitrophota bacterium]